MNKKILEDIITDYVDVYIDNQGTCNYCALYNPLKPCPVSEVNPDNPYLAEWEPEVQVSNTTDLEKCKKLLMKAVLANE